MRFLLIILALFSSFRLEASEVDLRKIDFTKDVVSLEASVDFYWNKLLIPSDLDQASDLQPKRAKIPSYRWQENSDLPDEGQASYHIRLRIDPEYELQILFIDLFGATKIFQNGKLVFESGSIKPYEAGFNLGRLKLDKTGYIDLIIQRKSHEHFLGGTGTKILVGTAELINKKLLSETFLGQAIFFLTLSFFILHMMIFFLRPKDSENFHFAMLAISVAIFITFSVIYKSIMLIFDYQFSHKIYSTGYNVWMLAAGFFILFLSKLFSSDLPKKYIDLIGYFLISWFLLINLFPPRWSHMLAAVPQLASSISCLGIIFFLVFKNYKKNRSDILIVAICTMIFILASILDMLRSSQLIQMESIVTPGPLGFLCLILSQSFVLARRFVRALDVSESYARNLEEQERQRTQFFQNTSHELRTPLNGMLGYLDLLLSKNQGELSASSLAKVSKVKNLGESLKLKVNTILDLAKAEKNALKLKNQRISLLEIKKECDLLVEGLLVNNSRLSYESSLSAEEIYFVTDKEKVLTLARNLLGNACKFCAYEKNNHVELSLIRDGSSLIMDVKDTGIGISKEHQELIFEAFKQVDTSTTRSYEGTGLGLHLVRQLVDLMGAKLELHSEVNKGTHFQIIIPESDHVDIVSESLPKTQVIEDDSLVNPITNENLDFPVAQGSWDIWVIDDHKVNCELICEILEHENYRLSSFQSAKPALEKMKDNPPDLLLLDLMMPEVSGEDVLRFMRKDSKLSLIPVVVLTARASEDDRMHVFSLGADEYLAKPIIDRELRYRLYYMFERIGLKETVKSEEKKRLAGERFLRNVVAKLAHNTNNPLNYIQSNLNFLERKLVFHMKTVLALFDEDDSDNADSLRKDFSHTREEFNQSLGAMQLGTHRAMGAIADIRVISGLDGLELKRIQLINFISKLEKRLNQNTLERKLISDFSFYANEASLLIALESILEAVFKQMPIIIASSDKLELSLKTNVDIHPNDEFKQTYEEFSHILSFNNVDIQVIHGGIKIKLSEDLPESLKLAG